MVALDQLNRRRYGPRQRRGGAGLFRRLGVNASKIIPKMAQYQFLTSFLNQRLTNSG
jgi:hypothetical protein